MKFGKKNVALYMGRAGLLGWCDQSH